MEVDFNILKRADRRPGALLLPPSVRARYGYKRADFLLGADTLGAEMADGIASDKGLLSMLTQTENLSKIEVAKCSGWLKQSADDITMAAFLEKSRDWSPQIRNGVNAMIGSNEYKVDVGELVADGMSTLRSILSVAVLLAAVPDPSLATKVVAAALIVSAIVYYAVTDWHELKKIFQDPPRFRYWIEAWGSNMHALNHQLMLSFNSSGRGVKGSFSASASFPKGSLFLFSRATEAWNGEKIARTFYKLKTLREGHSLYAGQPEYGDTFHAMPYEDHVRALARSIGASIPKISTSGWSSVYSSMASGGDEYTIAMITSLLLRKGEYNSGADGMKKLTHLAGEWPELSLFSPTRFYSGDATLNDNPIISNDYQDIYAASATLHQEAFARADAYGFPAALRFYYLNQSAQMQMPEWGKGSETGSVQYAAANRQAIHYYADMPGRQKFQGVIIGLIRAHAYQLLGSITEGIPLKLEAMAAAIEKAGAKPFKTDLIYPQEVIKKINQDAIAVATATSDPKGLQAVIDGVNRQPILQSIFKDRFIAPPKDDKSSGAALAIGAAALYALSQG